MGSTRSRAGLAVAGGAALGAAWLAQRQADRRRIAADPEDAFLASPPHGRVVPVTSPDGTRLHVEELGPEGAPAIVLAHGWTCELRFWAYQLRDLVPEFRVVAYDQRGHARSESASGGDWSIEAMAADLQAVLEACVPDGERALLGGHSMGGMTIVAWAGRFPEEVERRAAGAVLCNTGMGDLLTESLLLRLPPGFERAKQAFGRAFLGMDGPLPANPTPLTYRALRYIAHGPAATPAQVAFTERMALGTRRQVRAGCGASLTRLDLYDAVASLTVPTVVVAGEADRLTPPVHAQRMAETLPELVELAVVPRSGHMTPMELPEEVTGRMRTLARRTLAGEASAAG